MSIFAILKGKITTLGQNISENLLEANNLVHVMQATNDEILAKINLLNHPRLGAFKESAKTLKDLDKEIDHNFVKKIAFINKQLLKQREILVKLEQKVDSDKQPTSRVTNKGENKIIDPKLNAEEAAELERSCLALQTQLSLIEAATMEVFTTIQSYNAQIIEVRQTINEGVKNEQIASLDKKEQSLLKQRERLLGVSAQSSSTALLFSSQSTNRGLPVAANNAIPTPEQEVVEAVANLSLIENLNTSEEIERLEEPASSILDGAVCDALANSPRPSV